ncbi:tRNA (guanosine(46)-N7)-methyltransferase TrmB [Anaerobacillus alkalidiazotrophicus]|uniref:tRNA (guanine-N(7)-)-methyltransferase n=1 Tax=Anaerobacillus alkalidiazotrophicus TaxID=472963 RepID=A0A1S2M5E3_9BACI|nr:tRNA (guanosine(46)-N7)-methyltransferase TrmB [Anaerobacillus alkalidiazotrophicus]OIJ18204.1 tRNA (guanosine(46)-N7)-methyltransferase TrmB [Anaerobacillus alkalidiazotrophicus]OIJ19683.1 tRNA (guanosine(46)-N7)-methyltransferase TrmB [Anaerobacillus alkalidiazotrophicus]
MRLRNKPGASEALLKQPTIVIQNPLNNKGKWREIFGNDNPIHVEVGTGKGQFLTGMSQLHPDINYIGVEKYDSVIITALERIQQADLTNFKLLNEDVVNLINYFAEGEIDRVYINFTDPWPKNRHEKRRLTYESFLKMYEQVLKKNGEIHFKTDNQGLFEYSLHSFSKYGLILNNVSLDLHNSNIEGNVMTEYEEKFSQKGMRIYRCEAQFR